MLRPVCSASWLQRLPVLGTRPGLGPALELWAAPPHSSRQSWSLWRPLTGSTLSCLQWSRCVRALVLALSMCWTLGSRHHPCVHSLAACVCLPSFPCGTCVSCVSWRLCDFFLLVCLFGDPGQWRVRVGAARVWGGPGVAHRSRQRRPSQRHPTAPGCPLRPCGRCTHATGVFARTLLVCLHARYWCVCTMLLVRFHARVGGSAYVLHRLRPEKG